MTSSSAGSAKSSEWIEDAPECIVCFSSINTLDQLNTCKDDSSHAICDRCLVKHVQHLDTYRFGKNNGRVPCPARASGSRDTPDGWCGGVYDDMVIARVHVKNNRTEDLARYIDSALSAQKQCMEVDNGDEDLMESTGDLADRLLQQLNIRCPNCDAPQDPRPDGCRAVRCTRCGCRFCWICFHKSPSDNKNHQHVYRTHGDFYTKQCEVDNAHLEWRKKEVSTFLLHLLPCVRAEVISSVEKYLLSLHDDLVLAAQAAIIAPQMVRLTSKDGRIKELDRVIHEQNVAIDEAENIISELEHTLREHYDDELWRTRSLPKVAAIASVVAAWQSYTVNTVRHPIFFGLWATYTKTVSPNPVGAVIYATSIALLLDTLLIAFDFLRKALRFQQPRTMGVQIKRRTRNALLNVAGIGMGSYLGAICVPVSNNNWHFVSIVQMTSFTGGVFAQMFHDLVE